MVIDFEKWLLAFVAHRITKFKLSPQGIKALDEAPPEPPRCPRGRVKINMKKKLPLLPSAQVIVIYEWCFLIINILYSYIDIKKMFLILFVLKNMFIYFN